MSFYDLTKETRLKFVEQVNKDIFLDIQKQQLMKTIAYFSDDDTYVRKAAYLTIGKIYINNVLFQEDIISMLFFLLKDEDCKIRQTAVNAAGEIGIKKFEPVESIFDKGLFDEHHSVRNAVIGSVKKMGNKNPTPILNWARNIYITPTKKFVGRSVTVLNCEGELFPQTFYLS